MPASVDSLLVALLVVLTPEADAGRGSERLLAGVQTEHQAEQPEKPKTKLPEDPEACRYFVDPEARRKCAIRASRAASGSAEPQQAFPEGLFWLVPSEPPMPPRMPADTHR